MGFLSLRLLSKRGEIRRRKWRERGRRRRRWK
jgi:hypothetical protein